MRWWLKAGIVWVALGVAVVAAWHVVKARRQQQVEAAYARFMTCFMKAGPDTAPGKVCGAQVDSVVGEPLGYIQQCLSEGHFLRSWWREEGLQPPTYSAHMRCGPVVGSVIYAEITAPDGQWVVTTVSHTRSITD